MERGEEQRSKRARRQGRERESEREKERERKGGEGGSRNPRNLRRGAISLSFYGESAIFGDVFGFVFFDFHELENQIEGFLVKFHCG